MKNNLSERRDECELTQGDLGAAVGVSRQRINPIERDRYDPSLELVFKLAAYFDCQVEELFDPDIEPVGE